MLDCGPTAQFRTGLERPLTSRARGFLGFSYYVPKRDSIRFGCFLRCLFVLVVSVVCVLRCRSFQVGHTVLALWGSGSVICMFPTFVFISGGLRYANAADVIAQRIRAIAVANDDQSWDAARFLELVSGREQVHDLQTKRRAVMPQGGENQLKVEFFRKRLRECKGGILPVVSLRSTAEPEGQRERQDRAGSREPQDRAGGSLEQEDQRQSTVAVKERELGPRELGKAS